MQSVFSTEFGNMEMEPSAFILHEVIGAGHFGIVWKGM